MRILITGICGFVGGVLAKALLEQVPEIRIYGIDNFVRAGSEQNRATMSAQEITFFHGDIRCASDLDALPEVDWVIDAAANASVLAGLGGASGSRQLLEHNLGGTINLLEFCKRHRAGFILLSTSRVYSIAPLAGLKMEVIDGAFRPQPSQEWPTGVSAKGVAENCATTTPISLYGSSKLASEIIAMEYGATFDLPVWINRCGVLAGAGQFGRADQGIFSFWINSFLRKKPLKYIGFDGGGHQVRDCLHPEDLVPVLVRQMLERRSSVEMPLNFGGGTGNSMSLRQLSEWCAERFGPHVVSSDPTPRPFDIPWMVMDAGAAEKRWNWKPQTSMDAILNEIARHAEEHPNWLELSSS